ncbi:unnamed protein product [Dicrocoelium dendriticum]|nr:unnamed protein product [Dicrocoelium dendriticum]
MSPRRWSAPADLRKLSAVLKCYEVHRLCMISARQNADTSGVRAAGGSAVRCYPIGQHLVRCVLVHTHQSESGIYLRMQSGAACTLLAGAWHIQFVCVAMWAGPLPSFSIEPSDAIFFEIPQPTGGVTATVTLRNTGTSKLHYKLESTAPALYYFKPRYGSVCARQARSPEIFLLPFDFYHPENHKHELIVHIMLAQREEEENLHQLWEHNDQREILTRRVKCIPWEKWSTVPKKNRTIKCVYNVLNTPSSPSDSKPVGDALLGPD